MSRDLDLQPTVVTRPALLRLIERFLTQLAERANVAQFVSFGPAKTKQRFARIFGYESDHRFGNLKEAIGFLLAVAPEGTVNVRSFRPSDLKPSF